jgi:hypothetical protein
LSQEKTLLNENQSTGLTRRRSISAAKSEIATVEKESTNQEKGLSTKVSQCRDQDKNYR